MSVFRLLVHQYKLQFSGGKVEEGETCLQAALRELEVRHINFANTVPTNDITVA